MSESEQSSRYATHWSLLFFFDHRRDNVSSVIFVKARVERKKKKKGDDAESYLDGKPLVNHW